jgi:hypothetical protein
MRFLLNQKDIRHVAHSQNAIGDRHARLCRNGRRASALHQLPAQVRCTRRRPARAATVMLPRVVFWQIVAQKRQCWPKTDDPFSTPFRQVSAQGQRSAGRARQGGHPLGSDGGRTRDLRRDRPAN